MPTSPWLFVRAFAGRFLIALLVTSAVTVGAVAAVDRNINQRVESIRRVPLVVAPEPPAGANYLIIGSDSRAPTEADPGDAAGFGTEAQTPGRRSDTLMVAHIEPGARHALVVSFPRDMLVTVPGLPGRNKINSAYDTGGPQTVINMLRVNFSIEINHYIEVDFRSFRAVVDAIGRVPVYFPFPTRDDPNTPGGATTFSTQQAGCFAMNGGDALEYVRARHLQRLDPVKGWVDIDSDAPDIHRIARQQMFIRELAGIAIDQSLSDPFTAREIADRVLQYLAADDKLSRDDVNGLIRAFRTVDVNDTSAIEFATLPWMVNPADPLSSLVPQPGAADDMVARLRTFGANKTPSSVVLPSQVKVRIEDSTHSGIARQVGEDLAKQGFVVTGTGERAPVVSSEIRYAPNEVDEAKALSDYVPDAKLVPDPAQTAAVLLVLGASFQAVYVPTTTTTAPPAGGSTATVQPAPGPTTPAPPPPPTTLGVGSPC